MSPHCELSLMSAGYENIIFFQMSFFNTQVLQRQASPHIGKIKEILRDERSISVYIRLYMY